jgi:long-chain fatty acid transport protein
MIMPRLALLSALALAGSAHAAGFAVDTHGGRATGMATAVASHISDPSAVFYNPAGLLHTDELQLVLGDTVILPKLEFTSRETGVRTATGPIVSPPPHFYATARLGDDLAAGFGVFTQYGSTSNWPEDWEHRFRSLRSKLATYFLNPEAAWRPHERVRLGAGLQVVRATVEIERKLGFVDTEGSVFLSGGGWGLGFNAGLQVDVVPKLIEVGLAYRSSAALKFTGRAHFEDIPLELANTLRDQSLRTTVRTPDTAFAGVSVRPFSGLLLAADVNYYRWSNLPEIAIDFEDEALNQRLPKKWSDTFNYHLGAEYQLLPEIALRAGAVYDPTPSPEDTLTPDLPDSNRLKGAVGVGYTRDRLQLDLGYQIVLLRPVESSAPGYEGRYNGRAHVVSLSIGYRP